MLSRFNYRAVVSVSLIVILLAATSANAKDAIYEKACDVLKRSKDHKITEDFNDPVDNMPDAIVQLRFQEAIAQVAKGKDVACKKMKGHPTPDDDQWVIIGLSSARILTDDLNYRAEVEPLMKELYRRNGIELEETGPEEIE